jgi:hypothetical protein
LIPGFDGALFSPESKDLRPMTTDPERWPQSFLYRRGVIFLDVHPCNAFQSPMTSDAMLSRDHPTTLIKLDEHYPAVAL